MTEAAMNSTDRSASTVCRLTGAQAAAIAVFELRGPHALEAAATHLRFRNQKPLDQQPWNRIAFGFWKHPASGAETDGSIAAAREEDVVFCRTGAERAELHTHGSAAVAKSIFAAFRRSGVTVVETHHDESTINGPEPLFNGPLRTRDEVTRLLEPAWWEAAGLPIGPDSWPPELIRALTVAHLPKLSIAGDNLPAADFREVPAETSQPESSIEHSLWLLQNLAYHHLGRAKAHTVGRLLWHQVQGALVLRLWSIANQFQSQPTVAQSDLDQLLTTWSVGRFLSREIQVLVTGAPNVGKSSLINALLGYERSVVSETPGTTRDLVGQTTAIAGWQFRLIDSAGLRQTNDELEEQGVRRVALAQQAADLVLAVTSVDQPSQVGRPTLEGQAIIPVCNKIDLLDENQLAKTEFEPRSILVSTKTGFGMDALMSSMANAVLPGEGVLEPPQSAQTTAVVFAQEVYEWLLEWRSRIATG